MSSTIEKSTEPIRNTAAYKSLSETLVDALDDSGSAKHAGFEEKEARRLRRQRRLEKAGMNRTVGPSVTANPEYVYLVSIFVGAALIIIAQSRFSRGLAQGFTTAGEMESTQRNKSLPPLPRVPAGIFQRIGESGRVFSTNSDTDRRLVV